jgi:hypothetical protein
MEPATVVHQSRHDERSSDRRLLELAPATSAVGPTVAGWHPVDDVPDEWLNPAMSPGDRPRTFRIADDLAIGQTPVPPSGILREAGPIGL